MSVEVLWSDTFQNYTPHSNKTVSAIIFYFDRKVCLTLKDRALGRTLIGRGRGGTPNLLFRQLCWLDIIFGFNNHFIKIPLF